MASTQLSTIGNDHGDPGGSAFAADLFHSGNHILTRNDLTKNSVFAVQPRCLRKAKKELTRIRVWLVDGNQKEKSKVVISEGYIIFHGRIGLPKAQDNFQILTPAFAILKIPGPVCFNLERQRTVFIIVIWMNAVRKFWRSCSWISRCKKNLLEILIWELVSIDRLSTRSVSPGNVWNNFVYEWYESNGKVNADAVFSLMTVRQCDGLPPPCAMNPGIWKIWQIVAKLLSAHPSHKFYFLQCHGLSWFKNLLLDEMHNLDGDKNDPWATTSSVWQCLLRSNTGHRMDSPLKCRIFPDRPTPFSPVHRQRKFSAVFGAISALSSISMRPCNNKQAGWGFTDCELRYIGLKVDLFLRSSILFHS